MVETVRTDTGETISTRVATESEKQEVLPLREMDEAAGLGGDAREETDDPVAEETLDEPAGPQEPAAF